MRLATWTFIVCASVAQPGLAQAPPGAKLRSAIAASSLPGFCATSFDSRDVITEVSGGHARAGRAYRLDTIQPVASISKTVVGIVLAQLASRGEVDLDAPIETWIPWQVRNPRFPELPITLRQLATHTAGVVDREEIYNLSYQEGESPTLSMREFLRRYTQADGAWFSPENFGAAKPGARYQYSNVGAALAALAIEYKTGKDFRDYAQDAVFKPLGMTDSSFRTQPAKAARRAALFDDNGAPMKDYAVVTYADGSLHTTCRDLRTYLQSVMKARAGAPSGLDRATVDLMLAPQFDLEHLPENFKESNQGLFWEFNPREGLGHSGGDPGVTAHAYFDTETGVGYVFMANASAEENERYADSVRSLWRALRGRED